MKKLLFLFLLFFAFDASAQVKQKITSYGLQARRLQADSALRIPTVTVGIKDAYAGVDTAQIRYQTSDSSVKVYTGSQWLSVGSGTVTSVAALTLGTTGTDLSSTVATGTTTPVITLQVPTASSVNRGALSAADWTTFNNKISGITVGTTTITSGTNTRVGYNNAGVYGEYPITGTGNVMLSTSPTATGTLAAASISSSALTAGRVTFAGTAGLLTDSDRFKWNGNQLDITGAVNSGFRIYDPSGSNGWFFYNGAGLAGNFGMFDITANKDRFIITGAGVLKFGNEAHAAQTFSHVFSTGNTGLGGNFTPTARLHIAAGGTGANTAPIKLTSGSLNTTAEAGAVEFLTDAYYGTITTGAARKQFAFTSDNITVFASAQTSTSTTLADLTSMTLPLVAGTYLVEVVIHGSKATGTDGASFAVNYSGTTTSWEATQAGQANTTTWAATARITTINTASTTVMTTSAAHSQVMISGQLVVSNSGNVVVRAAALVSQTLTVRSSSYLKVTRIL